MPRIEILGQAITRSHGTLSTGDILNVSEEFAEHLVNQCRVAKYLDTKPATEANQPEKPSRSPSKENPPPQAAATKPATLTTPQQPHNPPLPSHEGKK